MTGGHVAVPDPFGADLAFSPAGLDGAAVARFRSVILGFYGKRGRSFPWRLTRDPWLILVSEVMLQQTQTERVLGKYADFIARFPRVEDLARAPLADVLASWQGLGYNRRARYLRDCAATVVAEHGGRFPETREELELLPGIGPYTAGAVAAFAFGKPEAFIETNIRTVFLHFFFPGRTGVADRDVLPLVELTLVRDDVRRWYWALMDYGVYLKSVCPNPSRRSASYVRQTRFEGSLRQARGAVLRELASDGPSTVGDLIARFGMEPERMARAVAALEAEGLVAVSPDGTIRLPE